MISSLNSICNVNSPLPHKVTCDSFQGLESRYLWWWLDIILFCLWSPKIQVHPTSKIQMLSPYFWYHNRYQSVFSQRSRISRRNILSDKFQGTCLRGHGGPRGKSGVYGVGWDPRVWTKATKSPLFSGKSQPCLPDLSAGSNLPRWSSITFPV